MTSMRKTFLLISIAIILLGALVCHAALNNYTMWLTAHPQAIVADSHSATTISAEVRDSTGKFVADGTSVDFTTSLGIIERRAQTSSGVARVRLESGSATGTALVSAVAADGYAVAQLQVDFLAPGTEMFGESFISVSSPKHLGYDSDSHLVDSVGGVTIFHRGLTITAHEAQIDVKTNMLRAKARMGGDDITISRGDKKLAASALYYDFNSMKGVFFMPASEGATRMLFRGRDMFVEPDKDPNVEISFEITPITASSMFIKARSLIIRPGELIKFKRASYYVDGDRLVNVPLQVVSLRGEVGGLDQMVAYGTDGVRMNIPFYYSLTPNGTGAVRLKHSEPTGGWGGYSDRPGWQVDIDQEYNYDGATQGKFSLNRVTTSDWGMQWYQRSQLANDSQVYTYLHFPAHQNLYGQMDYDRSYKDFTWSVNFRGNNLRKTSPTTEDSYSTSTYVRTRSKPLLGGAVNYALTSRLSYNTAANDGRYRVGSTSGMQLYGKPIRLDRSTSVGTSFNFDRDWGGSSRGSRIFANASVNRMLGSIGTLGVNYSYSWADSTYGYNAQRISTNISLRPNERFAASVFGVYGLSDQSMSAFSEFGYVIAPTWRLGLISNYQKMSSFSLTDYEVSLSKLLGRQEARLSYSDSRKKLRVEFTSASF